MDGGIAGRQPTWHLRHVGDGLRPGNTPAGRQYPATWTDASGNLWLFGGYGPDSNGTTMADQRSYGSLAAGEWTWKGGPKVGGQSGNYGSLGVASANGIPGARFEAASVDGLVGRFLAVRWEMVSTQWDTEKPIERSLEIQRGRMDMDGRVECRRSERPIWHARRRRSEQSSWSAGMKRRCGKTRPATFGSLVDRATTRRSGVVGKLNDLWKYSGGQWAWMGGSKAQNQKGVYGTQGTASASNIPGARDGVYPWTDSSGNLWLFGGVTFDANGSSGYINDLWKYSNGQWTWVSGSQSCVSDRGLGYAGDRRSEQHSQPPAGRCCVDRRVGQCCGSLAGPVPMRHCTLDSSTICGSTAAESGRGSTAPTW